MANPAPVIVDQFGVGKNNNWALLIVPKFETTVDGKAIKSYQLKRVKLKVSKPHGNPKVQKGYVTHTIREWSAVPPEPERLVLDQRIPQGTYAYRVEAIYGMGHISKREVIIIRTDHDSDSVEF